MIHQRLFTAISILVAAAGIAGFILFASHSSLVHAGGYNEGPGSWTSPADGPYDPSIGGCREYSGGMAVIPADGQAWCTYYDDTTGNWGCFYCPLPNRMPNAPSVGGPTTLYTNQTGTYSVTATDPDGDNILYWAGFGDGVGSFQTGYVPSGTTQYGSWYWSNPGTYTIDAVSYDGSLYSYHTYYTVNVVSPPPPACVPNYSASASTCPTSYYTDGCGNWYQGTAYCPVGVADLTTSTSLPTLSATVGVPVTLTAPAINQGSGSTGRTFLSEFIVGNSPGAWYNDINGTNVSTPTLAAYGGSANVSVTKTFNTAGTWYYQFCPNFYNMFSWLNDVSESNYSNNCDQVAGVVNVTPPAPPPPPAAPTCTLVATPASISSGQSSTLNWSSTDTTSTTGSGFSTGGASSGSTVVTPGTLPQNYGLQCVGPGGTTNAPPVSLGNSCVAGTLAMTMTASNDRVNAGASVTFNWTASNVQGSSCTVSDGTNSQTIVTNACSVAPGSASVAISHQTTYTITCDGQSKTATVNVIPAFNEF